MFSILLPPPFTGRFRVVVAAAAHWKRVKFKVDLHRPVKTRDNTFTSRSIIHTQRLEMREEKRRLGGRRDLGNRRRR